MSVCLQLYHGSIHTVVRYYAVFIALFSLILYNDNVNIGGNMKFSSYSSLYCFRLYDKLTYIAIYRGKYLQRRIPHASHGSFNPYIITNKERILSMEI